jgi:hypothetical protein
MSESGFTGFKDFRDFYYRMMIIPVSFDTSFSPVATFVDRTVLVGILTQGDALG